MGFVGWRAGELAAEIERGFWHVAEPDAGTGFPPGHGGMWEELVTRLGKGPAAPAWPRA